MRYRYFYLVLCLVSNQAISAQTSGLFESLKSALTELPGIQYEAECIMELSPHTIEQRPETAKEPKWSNQIQFKALGSRFYYSVNRQSSIPENLNSFYFAHDGSHYQFLDTKSNIIKIGKQPQKTPTQLWYNDPLIIALSFLKPTNDSLNHGKLYWSQIADPGIWSAFQSRASIEAKSPWEFIVGWGNSLAMQVKVGSETFFPIQYSLKNGGVTMRAYEVLDWAKSDSPIGKPIVYPQRARYQIYDDKGVLMRTDTHVFRSLSVVDKVDEDVFQIDPSLAQHIIDEDTNTWIKVPK
jgi:hypothetical protein